MLHVNLSKYTFTTRWSYLLDVDLAVLQPQIGNATHGLDIRQAHLEHLETCVKQFDHLSLTS